MLNQEEVVVDYETPALVSPSLILFCYDSNESVKTATNLIHYFQNLLYYDRGRRILDPPPGDFGSCPTVNLLLQIVNALATCQEATWPQIMDVKRKSIEMLNNGLYGLHDEVSADDLNNFLTNLSYLIYPNTFFTCSDCPLDVKLSPGAEKYYGLVRGFHSIGRQNMLGFLGKTVNFDAGNWVKLGTKAQYIKTLECVKVIGNCITVSDARAYQRVFKTYSDRIYRDRLLLYLAFITWCVCNQWSDNLLAFIYSAYVQNAPKRGSALTLEVVSSNRTEQVSDMTRGTVLRFLHGEDGFCPIDPSKCPPNSIQMIEAGRGLVNQEFNALAPVNETKSDCQEGEISLMVPKAYWELIIELQIHCFPGGKQDYCYESQVKPNDYCTNPTRGFISQPNMGVNRRPVFNDELTNEARMVRRSALTGVDPTLNRGSVPTTNSQSDQTHALLNSMVRRSRREVEVDREDENSEQSVSVQTTLDENHSVPSTIILPRRH